MATPTNSTPMSNIHTFTKTNGIDFSDTAKWPSYEFTPVHPDVAALPEFYRQDLGVIGDDEFSFQRRKEGIPDAAIELVRFVCISASVLMFVGALALMIGG